MTRAARCVGGRAVNRTAVAPQLHQSKPAPPVLPAPFPARFLPSTSAPGRQTLPFLFPRPFGLVNQEALIKAGTLAGARRPARCGELQRGSCPNPPKELPQNAAPAIGNLPKSRDGALRAGRGAITGARALGPAKPPGTAAPNAAERGNRTPGDNRMGPGDNQPNCGDGGMWWGDRGRNKQGGGSPESDTVW